MNILVTGANGQLGNEMRILAKNSADKYIFTDVIDSSMESITMLKKLAGDDINTNTVYLDITKLDAIRELVDRENVDAIVNCAAYTNVDGAEDPEKYALVEELNATAPENLAIVMKEVDGWLVQISTDYVFGKEPYNTPCKENQKGTPTGVYGATKLLGEQRIIATGCKYMILRTAWLYSEFGKNFVKTMLNLTSSKAQLNVVFDQTGTPTYARDLATAIVASLREPVEGIYHYSNEGVCSWYDFTKMIAEYAGYTSCDIHPCHSEEFPSPVKRPAYSVLDKTKIKRVFQITIPYWTDSLKNCIKNILQKTSNMKVVLLAGGFGSRISEESQFKPKPMIEIGGMPILWHIMKEYAYFGYTEFIVCAGYKQEYIKEWFANYFLHNSDVTFDYRSGKNEMTVHQTNMEPWKVTVVDTGYNTMTGGRIKRIQKYVGDEPFMLTYGDGVCDVEIDKLVEFHRGHGKLATLTAVKMAQDKGVLDISENNSVRSFREKSVSDGAPINAGYMVLQPEVFDLLDGDSCVFEKTALVELANKGELMSYIHEGFWQCMDNIREKNMLENLLAQNKAPWKRWDRQVPSIEARKVTGNI